jgi:hypothetical protein
MLDAYNKMAYVNALTPNVKITASTNGVAVDLSSVNNGANKLVFALVSGTITDGTYTFKLQDSPDNSTWTDVPAVYQQGPSVASFTSATTAGTTVKLGYLGNTNGANRYVRVVVAVASATTGGFISGIATLEGLGYLP